MGSARTAVGTVVIAAAVLGPHVPAAAATIVVTPSSPHPGQRVHISVPGCSVGTIRHTAMSRAFTHPVELFGKADTGEADPTIKKGLAPGTYPIVALCGARHTVRGRLVVVSPGSPAVPATPSPSASPTASDGTRTSSMPYWVLGAAAVILGVGAGVYLGRRHGGPP